MCENLYYTITDFTIIDQDTFDITDIVSDAKNKIIEDQELEDHELEEKLTNYSYLTLKQLNLICDYYGITSYIRITKCNKEDIINTLVLYENTYENYEIVVKRKRMWKYLAELKKDKFMKKFIIN
jgi:hypothetical protein